MAQENKSGLVNKINQHLLCAQLNMRNQLTLKTLSLSNQELKIIRQYIQKKHNFNSVSTNKQLKFDSNFLNETKYSEFINHIWSLEHKRIASKFRIRQYNLKIETGRFARPHHPHHPGHPCQPCHPVTLLTQDNHVSQVNLVTHVTKVT